MTGKQMSESNYTNNNMITATNLIPETCLESLWRKWFSPAVQNRHGSTSLPHHNLKENVHLNVFDSRYLPYIVNSNISFQILPSISDLFQRNLFSKAYFQRWRVFFFLSLFIFIWPWSQFGLCATWQKQVLAPSLFSSLHKSLPCCSVLSYFSFFFFLPFLTKLQYFNILCFSLFLPSYKSNPCYEYFRKYKVVYRGRILPISQWSEMTIIKIWCVSVCFFLILCVYHLCSIYSGSTTYQL